MDLHTSTAGTEKSAIAKRLMELPSGLAHGSLGNAIDYILIRFIF